MDKINTRKGLIVNIASIWLFPVFFYLVFFVIITYPLIRSFSTHLFADQSDGLVYVWNIWWVNKALIQLHQSPWYTNLLHYPYGILLFGHSLALFNGLMGIFLLKFLTLIATYNFIVVFSFVTGGLTAFWLAYYFTKSYWGSIIGGYIFTFSNYHFAHAQGHLDFVALEWIPLFLLFWHILVTRPSVIVALASAITLYAVILCAYHFFFYCLLTAIIIAVWQAISSRDIFCFFKKRYLFPFLSFFATLLVTSAPLVISLLLLNVNDPLAGGHKPKVYSLDLFAPLIPGGHWRFAGLTESYWSRLPGNIHESSVCVGIAVLFMATYVWLKRRNLMTKDLALWYIVFVFFGLLSLGPVLHVWGKEIAFIKLPYALLARLLPPLKISSIPVRMMLMVILSLSVICAAGFQSFLCGSAKKRFAAFLLLSLLFIEYLPKPMPCSLIPVPEYINVLKKLPGNGGVIDLVNTRTLALYYQTIHEKPIAFGYVSRVPKSVKEKDDQLKAIIKRREFSRLYAEYNIRYLIGGAAINTADGQSLVPIRTFYRDSVALYDLGAAESKR